MSDFTLRGYLQLKGSDPNQGVRFCAPNLTQISLKDLFSINRIIIHLSDFHIGLNDEVDIDGKLTNPPVSEAQVQKIVYGIIETYKDGPTPINPKPIVVITGDLVDHIHLDDNDRANHDHVKKLAELLQPLKDAEFTVLIVPGSHDYSDPVDVDNISWLENCYSGDIITAIINGILKVTLENQADDPGINRKLGSGNTYTDTAYQIFYNSFKEFMQLDKTDSDKNGVYSESWKDKGAVYDLDFILLDALDHHTNQSLTGKYAQIDKKFFFHDNTCDGHPVTTLGGIIQDGLRSDYGWLEDRNDWNEPFKSDLMGINFLKTTVNRSSSSKSLPIVALHYPLSNPFGTFVPSTSQALARLILNIFPADLNSFDVELDLLGDMFVGAALLKLLPKDQLKSLIDKVRKIDDRVDKVISDKGKLPGKIFNCDAGYGEDLYNISSDTDDFLNRIYGADPVTTAKYTPRVPYSPSKSGLVNEAKPEVIEGIINSHLLLVGHSHHRPRPDSIKYVDPRYNSYSFDPLESCFNLSLALNKQGKVSKAEIRNWLGSHPTFLYDYGDTENIKQEFLDSFTDLAMNADLNNPYQQYYMTLKQKQLENKYLNLISGAGSTLPDPRSPDDSQQLKKGSNNWADPQVLKSRRNWVEININLLTGEISATPKDCPEQRRYPD